MQHQGHPNSPRKERDGDSEGCAEIGRGPKVLRDVPSAGRQLKKRSTNRDSKQARCAEKGRMRCHKKTKGVSNTVRPRRMPERERKEAFR